MPELCLPVEQARGERTDKDAVEGQGRPGVPGAEGFCRGGVGLLPEVEPFSLAGLLWVQGGWGMWGLLWAWPAEGARSTQGPVLSFLSY